MTTDDTSSASEPVPPQAAIRPEVEYPDPRTEAQLENDQTISAEQSAALTDTGEGPHRRVNTIIREIQEQRRRVLAMRLPNPPIQIEVLPGPGQPDQPDQGDVILVAPGEMLLRVPAGGLPDGEPGVAADEGPAAWRRAHTLLQELGYAQSSEDFPDVLPLRKYTAPDRTAEQLVQDRDRVRRETGAEVDLNYVATAGHLVKADDYPRNAEAVHRCYTPEWIRCHPVTRPVTVAVIDTGINHLSRADGWLTGIPERAANEDPLDVFPVPPDGVLDLSAGHGTFVAGVVEQVAPAATIVVYRVVDTQGMAPTDVVANGIIQAARDGADIINASLGTMTVDDLPPLTFTTALDIVQAEHPDVLIVASAGNMGQDTPMFPAAMKGVVGVGALAADLITPAPWSNRGFWVNCSTVGIGIISTFVPGKEEPHTDASGNVVTEQFGPDAWAIWSGTSFSAPQIAGKVAQLCQMNNVRPAVALTQLLAGKPVLPGFGHVVPILPGS
jgi:subtilisin family serine protease